MDAADFQLPDDADADMVAIAQLAASLARLTEAVDSLHQQYLDLRDIVTRAPSSPARPGPDGMPWPLRWRDLDRDSAAMVWAWLIDWVGWAVDRYQLAEEIPVCWYRHAPLTEELSALAAAWQLAYDDTAPADAPLLWHERFARARTRLHDWDDYTRCRNGTHTDRHLDLDWAANWRVEAIQAANTDLAARPVAERAGLAAGHEERPS